MACEETLDCMAWTTFAAIGDTHGDMINRECGDAFLGFVDALRPDVRIHLGDYMDCRPLRRGASDEEKSEGMQADYDAAESFLLRFRPNVVLDGNHDARLKNLAENGSGILREWAQHGVNDLRAMFEFLECPVLPYNVWRGVYRLGGLSFLHGFTHGMNCLTQPMAAFGNVIMGHVHYASAVSRFGYQGWTTGCGCDVDLGYNSTRLTALAQSNGWISGAVNLSTGAFHVTPTVYRGANG